MYVVKADQTVGVRAVTVGASEVIRRLQAKLASVQGITLFLQPVQELTVEDRMSRTQYQYTLEDTNWAPRLVEVLQTLPRAA